jgi:phosphonate transport system substrate-binding protein
MSENSQSTDFGSSKPQSAAWSWFRMALLICLAAAVAVVVDATVRMFTARTNREMSDVSTVNAMGLVEPQAKGLAPGFTDSQGRLLADPPSSPDKFIDPSVIVVAHWSATDPEDGDIAWSQFEAHLAKVTGRKVSDQAYDNSPDALAQIQKGSITLVALHAADAPFLVNNYGYQPAAVLGDDSGANGNHLDIIVPADSKITKTSDLRGQSLVCTVPSSITGYRAAIAMLMGQDGLRPNVDYSITWSMGQKKSITGIASHDYVAAAVSDDKLQSLIAKGTVSPSETRVIYQSAVIPRMTIGWFYNLNPALSAKVQEAILSFRPEAPTTRDADVDSSAKPLHFIAADYKKDFEFVRKMDDRFDPRLDSNGKGKLPHTPTASAADLPVNNIPD